MKLSYMLLGALHPFSIGAVSTASHTSDFRETQQLLHEFEESLGSIYDGFPVVTIEAPQGKLTLHDSYLIAVPNEDSTIWMLHRNESNQFLVITEEPAGGRTYWQGGSGCVEVGSKHSDRFNIKMLSEEDGKGTICSDDGCLHVAETGEVFIGSNTTCTVLAIKEAEIPEWMWERVWDRL